MTELVRIVFSVSGIVLFLLVGALWIWSRPQSKLARRFLIFVAMASTLTTTYSVGYALNRLLVIGLTPLAASDVPPGRTAIVVLGSGSFTVRDWDGNQYSSTDVFAASRVLEAVRVYKLVGADWVISSGGRVRSDDPREPTGVVMKDLLLQLGVPASRVLMELTPTNTHDEAVAVARLRPKLNFEHLVLVTSETHMRRSLGTFRAEGLRPIPAIAKDPIVVQAWKDWIVPGEDGLWASESFAHEVFGIAYYAARGWYRF